MRSFTKRRAAFLSPTGGQSGSDAHVPSDAESVG